MNLDQCGKETRTIKHDLGTTTITGNPIRVVALEGSVVDALIWAGIKPVGIADDNNKKILLPQLLDLAGDYTSVGLRATPNLQVITSLKPDLIIGDTSRHKAIYSKLAQIAPTVEFPSNHATYQQILDSAMLIGQSVNKCDALKTRLDALAQTMSDLKSKVPSDESRTALFAVSADKTLYGQTASSFAPSVLASIGLKPALAPANGDALAELSLETLVTTKPGIMFISFSSDQDTAKGWAKSPLWKELPAVRDNAFFTVDRAMWSKSRGLLAAELIAREAVKDLYGK